MGEVIEKAAKSSKEAKPSGVLVKCSVGEVMRCLKRVMGVVESRSTIPVLRHVLIERSGERVTLTASDGKHQMVASFVASGGEGQEALTVNAHKLQDILKALPEDASVSMTPKGGTLTIKCLKSRFVVQSLPAEDFPKLMAVVPTGTIRVTEKALGEMFGMTSYAMACGDVRFYLNGMLLEIENGRVRGVASDGHRLATSWIDGEVEGVNTKVILHRKVILELQRLLTDGSDEVAIELSDKQARFVFRGMSLQTELIEGTFPDYRRVLPADWKGMDCLTLDRAMIEGAMKRCALMSDNKNVGVAMKLESGTLTLKGGGGEESLEEEIGTDFEGEKRVIGVNVNFMTDALAAVKSDLVTWGMPQGDSQRGILIEHPGVKAYRAVVMPMRL